MKNNTTWSSVSFIFHEISFNVSVKVKYICNKRYQKQARTFSRVTDDFKLVTITNDLVDEAKLG